MDFLEFIIEEALILIPVLFAIGMFLKQTPLIRDWIIPYILLAIGVALSLALLGFYVESVIQGVLVTAAAVFSHQLFKQYKERESEQ